MSFQVIILCCYLSKFTLFSSKKSSFSFQIIKFFSVVNKILFLDLPICNKKRLAWTLSRGLYWGYLFHYISSHDTAFGRPINFSLTIMITMNDNLQTLRVLSEPIYYSIWIKLSFWIMYTVKLFQVLCASFKQDLI